MNTSRETMKIEALSRMRKIGYADEAIHAFETANILLFSNPYGKLKPISPKLKAQIDFFESENNALVYMVIGSRAFGQKMVSFVYVTSDDEVWYFDNEDIDEGRVFTYTINLNSEELSEFGEIGIQMFYGVPIRIY